MNTPIFDFVNNYEKSQTARLHMPGHKGVSFLGCESFDITEISGADELYRPDGIIFESEKSASKLFGTARTVYSAGGSSQSINAMLFLAYSKAKKDGVRPFVLAGRNAHKSFIYAAAKLDIDVEWIYPQNSTDICSCVVTPQMLQNTLSELNKIPFAVYITSPDYLGKMTDICELSKICKRYDIPLLVDNAHGAYTAFLENSAHPIHLGADMCCDSAHKTLPVLTGGGYLHIANDDRFGFADGAVRAMEIFGSTSPSYLILSSLDLCNKYISENIKTDLRDCVQKAEKIKKIMRKVGVPDISDEPLKITADFSEFIAPNSGFSQYFRDCGIEYEYADGEYIVFMLSPQNSDKDFERLASTFKNLPLEKRNISREILPILPAKRAMSIRDAVFSQSEEIDVCNSLGRVCASPTVSCPPAVPIAVSGEIINENHIQLFKPYGINKIAVVCE